MKTRYWLFLVLDDWFPGLWRVFVEMGIAAHHYPSGCGWTNEKPNIERLQELTRGHHIIAGFGRLTSGFYRGGPSLEIRRGRKLYAFNERVDCDWRVIPPSRDPPFINCHDLKAKGFKIDLERGRGIREIERDTFEALVDRLRTANAIAGASG